MMTRARAKLTALGARLGRVARIDVDHGDTSPSQGALGFNLMDPNWLSVYDLRDSGGDLGGNRGFKKIEAVQRYPKPCDLPSPKFSIDWIRSHFASQYEFLRAIAEDKEPSPSFQDGYRVKAIMDAAYLSASQQRWVKVEELL